jgi:lipid-binding SYLF domain-containing protein
MAIYFFARCRMRALWLVTLVSFGIFEGAVSLGKSSLEADVRDAVSAFKKKDPSITKLFDEALAYVVYPNVGKGGFFVGGAHGNGIAYEKGRRIGSSTLVQATVGLQFGGQEFSEVVFFETEKALEDFKASKLSVSAQVSAVVSAEGEARKAKFHRGVAVFVLPKSGAMVEASVGGQKLEFVPK